MNEVLKTIIADAPVSIRRQQETWEKISEKMIARGTVERLSEPGFLQAIDVLAYEIVQDGCWCIDNNISEEDGDTILEEKTATLDKALRLTALGAGIHPTIVEMLLESRVDYYTSIAATKYSTIR